MQKLNITKEEFLKIINDIRTQQEKMERFNKALDEMCSGYILFDAENKYFEALLFTLSKMFYQTPNSEFNTIDWYLFEGIGDENEHTMYYEGYEININTDELCYDLLCAEFEQRANGNDEPMLKLFKAKGSPIDEEEYYKKHNIIPAHFSKNVSADEILEMAKENYIKKLEGGQL